MNKQYKIFDMKCDYRKNPIGIRYEAPRFSWKIQSGEVQGGKYQSAYQIRVRDIEGSYIWDSGKVVSGKQNNVSCEKLLLPHSRYFWSVRIWDDEDVSSVWSDEQMLITVLKDEEWLGSWITYDGVGEIQSFRDHVWIRREFILEEKTQEVFLYLASLGLHDLYVNGQKADDRAMAPARGNLRNERVTVNYITYDISSLLIEGVNVIGIAMDAGYTRMSQKLVPALRLQMYGRNLEMHSDAEWKCVSNGNQYLGEFCWGDYGGEKTVIPASETKWSTSNWDAEKWYPMRILYEDYKLREEASEPDKIVEELHPVSIEGEGELRVDMGRNFTGWLGLRLPKLSEEVIIEVSDKEDSRCAFNQKLTYSPGLKRGGWYCSQFNYISGRYFTISGLKFGIKKEDIRGYVISNSMERRGSFCCDNELLNQIYETDLRTYQANTIVGITADCPHRERLGYGETGANTTWADGLLNFDAGAFYRNYIRTWTDTQREDGYFAHTSPDHTGGGGTVWSSYPIIGSAYFYRYFGDQEFLCSVYPSLVKWVEFLHQHEKNGLLERYEFGEWDFLGDWATPDGDDWGHMETALYFNNCCYAYVLLQMQKFAQLLGKNEEKTVFENRHALVSQAIRGEFWHPEGYLCKRDARYQASALAAGIVLKEQEMQVEAEMRKIIQEKGYVDGGSAGTFLLLHVLSQTETGNHLIYKWMCKKDFPSYGNFVTAGETTWPEMWDMRNVYGASRIHTCYTGCAGWILEGLCGVLVNHENIVIKPYIPEDMNWVQCELDSLWGKIYFTWERQDTNIQMAMEIPFSAKAQLIFGEDIVELYPGKQVLIFPIYKS